MRGEEGHNTPDANLRETPQRQITNFLANCKRQHVVRGVYLGRLAMLHRTGVDTFLFIANRNVISFGGQK